MPNQSNPNSSQPVIPTVFPQSDLPPILPDFQNIAPDNPVTPTVNPPPTGSSVPPATPPAVTISPKKKFGGGRIIATILGIFLLVGAVGAGVVLTGQKQLFQQKAATNCTGNPANQCDPGSTECQKSSSGQNTGYNCTCLDLSDTANPCKHEWQCNTQDLSACSITNGQACASGYTKTHIQECKKNCANTGSPGDSWYWINATAGSQCGTGNGGVPKYTCDYDECDSGTVTTTPTAPPGYVLPDNNVITFPKAGKVRIYYYDKTRVGQSFGSLLLHMTKSGQTLNPQLPGGPLAGGAQMEYLDTDISVNAGDTFTITSYYGSLTDPNVGWIAPTASKQCGAPGHLTDVAPQIDYATGFGEQLVSPECWGDPAIPGDPYSTYDYNDLFVIFSYTPVVATPTPTPSPSPSPSPNPTGACLNVKAYSSTWTALSSSDLSAQTPGTTINFCVAGSASSGSFDKAQFKINTVLEAETTTKRPSSNDFCQSYTILPTDTTVSVQAKIHHTTLGWFGESI